MISYKRLSNIVFGWLSEKYLDDFSTLKGYLNEANINVLFKSYVSMVFMTTFLTSIFFTIFFTIALNIWVFEPLLVSFLYGLVFGLLVGFVTFVLSYIFPMQRAKARARNIKGNLAFAANHMSAVASSKVPPYVIFDLLSGFDEYGEISNEAKKIVRNVDTFGKDIATSIREVAKVTPCKEFSELLDGMVSTIETGGNLEEYLRVQAEESMFQYRINREKYLDSLSTYADFYTAVLIAAPLFLIAILAVMNMVGGEIELLGRQMEIRELMSIGTYVIIPVMNIAFILFIYMTQPEVV